MSRFAGALLAACVASLLSARAARADAPSGGQTADVLFRQGRQAMKQQQWAVAWANLSKSERLDPAPGTRLNLAECEDHLGELTQALDHLWAALASLPAGDARTTIAATHIALLEKRVAHLTLDVDTDAPAGTSVRRDDVTLTAADLGVDAMVDPGPHRVVVVSADGSEKAISVDLEEGERRSMIVGAPPPGLAEPHEDESAHVSRDRGHLLRRVAVAPAPRPWSPQQTDAVVLGGAGAAGVLVGVTLGLIGKSEYENSAAYCDGTACHQQAGVDFANRGRAIGDAGTVVGTLGLVALAAGAVLWLTAPDGSAAPSVGVGPAGIAARGTF
jgi:hypothetical protein